MSDQLKKTIREAQELLDKLHSEELKREAENCSECRAFIKCERHSKGWM